MRLFLIPISARRTLIYGQRLNKITQSQPSLADKASARAAKLWLSWEESDTKWKKVVTEYGNKAFNRIPFEEWALKSIPPLSTRKDPPDAALTKVEVIYPPSLIGEKNVPQIIRRLATERNMLHRSRLMWSIIGMPISAPFALVPVIPNIPFFYLCFRAFSHWKALNGAKHLHHLVDRGLLELVSSQNLDAVYARRNMKAIVDIERLAAEAKIEWKDLKESIGHEQEQGKRGKAEDSLLIHPKDAREIAIAVDIPSLAVECERACKQVASQLRIEAELEAQEIRKEEAEKASSADRDTKKYQ